MGKIIASSWRCLECGKVYIELTDHKRCRDRKACAARVELFGMDPAERYRDGTWSTDAWEKIREFESDG